MTDEERIAQIRARATASHQAYPHVNAAIGDINLLLGILDRRSSPVESSSPSPWQLYAQRLRERAKRIRESPFPLANGLVSVLYACADEAAKVDEEMRKL
jgi:hypothetical protein